MTTNCDRKSGCPVAYSLDCVGDKWSLLVVRDMLVNDASTYGEFLLAGEGIATNILANRLKVLTLNGIVTKSRDSDNRRKYRYTLTEKGRALAPLVQQLMEWGAKYDPDTLATPEIMQAVTKKLKVD